MTQSASGFSEDLAEIFERLGLDRYAIFREPEQAMDLLLNAGNDAIEFDDFHTSENAYSDGIKLSKFLDKSDWEGKFKNRLSYLMDLQGKQVEALEFLDQAYNIYVNLNDLRGQAVSLCKHRRDKSIFRPI